MADTSTQTICNYKIYCNTENMYVYGWGSVVPTTCYNNNTHNVNVNSVQIVSTISPSVVTINQNPININGSPFVLCMNILDVAPGATGTVETEFLVDIALFNFKFAPTDVSYSGDSISITGNPNTNLGLIGEDIAINSNTIVSPLLFAHGGMNYSVTLTDGTNTNDMGVIISNNSETNAVTTSNSSTNAFSATNTEILLSVKIFNELLLGSQNIYTFFESRVTPLSIPAGSVLQISYTNNSTTGNPKSISFYVIYFT
jgi:hypothetical protein